MTSEPLFQESPLDEAVAALRGDLLADGGPQTGTMRDYRFAILPYRPSDEFKLRRLVRQLADELCGGAQARAGLTMGIVVPRGGQVGRDGHQRPARRRNVRWASACRRRRN